MLTFGESAFYRRGSCALRMLQLFPALCQAPLYSGKRQLSRCVSNPWFVACLTQVDTSIAGFVSRIIGDEDWCPRFVPSNRFAPFARHGRVQPSILHAASTIWSILRIMLCRHFHEICAHRTNHVHVVVVLQQSAQQVYLTKRSVCTHFIFEVLAFLFGRPFCITLLRLLA